MELIDIYHRPETYTFVFDDVRDEQHLMLEMADDRWEYTDYFYGEYDPTGDNERLGVRQTLQELGEIALTRFFQRLSIPDQFGRAE